MSTPLPEPTTRSTTAAPPHTNADAWLVLLAILSGAVALGDVVFMLLIPSVIAPLAIAAVVTLVGLTLLRGRPRAAIVVLGVTSLLLLVTSLVFLSAHLAHPGSAIDFLHAVLAIVGRALAVVAAVGAWRGASRAGARRLAAVTLGLAAVAIVTAAVAALTTIEAAARPGDITVVIEGSRFPDTVVVGQGEVLHLDNQDRFRHTFTVPDTALDVDLPASSAARATVELAPGSYDVICDIPGHEHMTGVIDVR